MGEGTDLSLALILTENLENSNFSVLELDFIQLESKITRDRILYMVVTIILGT